MLDLSELAEKDPAVDLEHHFRRRFAARYKHAPVITDGDNEVFEWLIREFGKPKAVQVIDKYIQSNDRFICEKGHAPKFIKGNINSIIAGLGAPRPTQVTGIRVRVPLTCDRCKLGFEWTGTAKELDARRLCYDCRRSK